MKIQVLQIHPQSDGSFLYALNVPQEVLVQIAQRALARNMSTEEWLVDTIRQSAKGTVMERVREGGR